MLLEVIVTSVEEAKEAEAGGADRLELCRSLDQEGLTPDLEIVQNVVRAVSIPVRAMVRPRHSMIIDSAAELRALLDSAAALASTGVSGLVAGYLKSGSIDLDTMRAIANAAPGIPVTFHRAIDELPEAISHLAHLRRVPSVDRVLTHARAGKWDDRAAALQSWRAAAGPDLQILFAAGLDAEKVKLLSPDMPDLEVHVGRAAREPQRLDGAVSRLRIAQLKDAL